jgi:hypothetical protein
VFAWIKDKSFYCSVRENRWELHSKDAAGTAWETASPTITINHGRLYVKRNWVTPYRWTCIVRWFTMGKYFRITAGLTWLAPGACVSQAWASQAFLLIHLRTENVWLFNISWNELHCNTLWNISGYEERNQSSSSSAISWAVRAQSRPSYMKHCYFIPDIHVYSINPECRIIGVTPVNYWMVDYYLAVKLTSALLRSGSGGDSVGPILQYWWQYRQLFLWPKYGSTDRIISWHAGRSPEYLQVWATINSPKPFQCHARWNWKVAELHSCHPLLIFSLTKVSGESIVGP